jgi:class 3 adenylate cyclase/ActR/RegA family two-component response regulator
VAHRILIVEDNEEASKMLEEMLLPLGYEVDRVYNGKDALSKVASCSPDLILLDVMMPGLSGFEVCKSLKADNKSALVPIIMITALNDFDSRVKGIEAGADDFLGKPFNPMELKARVKSLLRIRSLQSQLEERERLLSKILGHYMPEDIHNLIIQNPDEHLKLGGEIREVTVMFADISGFTGFAEEHNPKATMNILNTVLSPLTEIVFQYGGTFDKYLGDALMTFWGAPVQREDDVMRALKAALAMQEKFRELQRTESVKGFASLGLHIGINTGPAVVGNIGSNRIMDYTVIGDTVNTAKKIQEIASGIVIGENTFHKVSGFLEAKELPASYVKGRKGLVKIYLVSGLKCPIAQKTGYKNDN